MSSNNDSDKVIHIRSCRICLDSQCTLYVTLCEENGWLKLFEYCFGISLKGEDEPRILCYGCAVKLKKFYAFKAKCKSSEELWKYLAIRRCRVESVQLKYVKNVTATEHNESNCSIEKYGDKVSYSNRSPSNNSIDIKIKHKTIDNRILVNNETNLESREIIPKNESTDLIHNSKIDKDLPTCQSIKSKDKFTCSKCFKIYNANKWFLKHLAACKPNKQLSRISSKNNKININVNISKSSQKYQEETTHLCGICKFTSKDIEGIHKHFDGHWTNHDLQCMICEYVGKDQAAIFAHRYVHYESKCSPYLCHICHKKARSQLTLQFHYRKDHLNKPGGLCSQPNCEKVYNCWRMWKKHEKLHIHPGYVCDICGQKYKYKHLILEHIINHTNPPAHICDVCGKIFSRMRYLKYHITNVHEVSNPVKCAHCSRSFKNQFQLVVHQKRIAMKKTLKCEYCPMEYSMMSQLSSHLKCHSEDRPHCCRICGSRYKAKCQLAIHMRNHTGDRPYKCDLCIKAFTSASQLRVHTMSHTGVLPVKCLHCEKTFRYKKRMLEHCAIRHKSQESMK